MTYMMAPVCFGLLLLSSCGPSQVHIGVAHPAEKVIVVEDGGPPPWAPAHGTRRHGSYRYRYYQHEQIYYDLDRRVYFYREPGLEWRMTASLPAHVMLGNGAVVDLDMTDERPWKHHDGVAKSYPRGSDAENDRKGRKKSKGKHHGHSDRRN